MAEVNEGNEKLIASLSTEHAASADVAAGVEAETEAAPEEVSEEAEAISEEAPRDVEASKVVEEEALQEVEAVKEEKALGEKRGAGSQGRFASLKTKTAAWADVVAGVKAAKREAPPEEVLEVEAVEEAPQEVEAVKEEEALPEKEGAESEGLVALKKERAAWAEVVASVQARKAFPLEEVLEEVEAVEEEAPQEVEPSEEQKEFAKRMIEAGRHLKGRRSLWGLDRHIYHRIVTAVDKRTDKHVDRLVGEHVKKHRFRVPVDKRKHRGPGLVTGAYPFRKMDNWRH